VGEQVHQGQLFDRYAVLGDDVVIADHEVAQVYERALGELGVTISYQKSLISDTGSLQDTKDWKEEKKTNRSHRQREIENPKIRASCFTVSLFSLCFDD
jgi:hypothetical protein